MIEPSVRIVLGLIPVTLLGLYCMEPVPLQCSGRLIDRNSRPVFPYPVGLRSSRPTVDHGDLLAIEFATDVLRWLEPRAHAVTRGRAHTAQIGMEDRNKSDQMGRLFQPVQLARDAAFDHANPWCRCQTAGSRPKIVFCHGCCRRSLSIATTSSAPRTRASQPIIPLPQQRSSHRHPCRREDSMFITAPHTSCGWPSAVLEDSEVSDLRSVGAVPGISIRHRSTTVNPVQPAFQQKRTVV